MLLLSTTHVGSATASFKDLVTVVQENSTNQQLQPPLDLATVSKEQIVHIPNNRTKHALNNSNSDRNCQPNKNASMSVLGFTAFTSFCQFFVCLFVCLFHWIEKQSCCRCALGLLVLKL